MAVFTRQRVEANIATGRAVELVNEDLSELNLSRLKLQGANLERANLSNADLREANLERADLRKADLHEANLCGANLSHACLDGADLREANLRGAKLSGAKLRGASWPEANLEEAKLRRARLGEVDLSGRTLSGVDLRLVNLNGANFYKINLQRVNLNGAQLRGANLNAAQLSEVDLRGADLTAAALEKAQLRKVDLTAAVLDGVHLLFANYDKQTQWPSDFDPSIRGASIVTDDQDLTPSLPHSSLTSSRSSGGTYDDLFFWLVIIGTLGLFVLYFSIPFDLPAHISLFARLITRFLEILFAGGGFLGIMFVADAIFGERDDRGFSVGAAIFFLTLATACLLLQIFLFPLTFTLLGQIILIPLVLISLLLLISILSALSEEEGTAATTSQSLDGIRQETIGVPSQDNGDSLQVEKREHFQHAHSDLANQNTTAVASSGEKVVER